MKARLIRLYPIFQLGPALALSAVVLGAARGCIGPGWGDILTVAAFGLLLPPAPMTAGYGDDALYPANKLSAMGFGAVYPSGSRARRFP